MAEQLTETRPAQRFHRFEHAMNVLLAISAVAAIAALVLEYGFRQPVVALAWLHVGESVIVAVFVLDRFGRLLLARRRGQWFRSNIVDFVLMGVAAVVLAVSFRKVLSAGALYVCITQAYLLAVLVLRGVGLNLRFAGSGIHPAGLLVGSFAAVILVGSGLLMLPVAVEPDFYTGWHWLDSLFTATSATCVTGLVVRDTGAHFTHFGQAVILAMVQCGGLGIMLFGTVLGLLVGRALTLRQSDTLGQMIATDGLGSLARVAVFVIVITFAFELVGAAAMLPMFTGSPDTNGEALTTAGAVWQAAFHSISSFCNAGFSLYGKNMMHGISEGWPSGGLSQRWQIMGVMAPLIILGGLGFPVLQDCGRWLVSRSRRCVWRIRRSNAILPTLPRKVNLTLHSRIVIATSLMLVLAGAALLMVLEQPRRNEARIGANRLGAAIDVRSYWRQMPPTQRAREALFQSVTARTAGFNTIDMAELSDAGKLWMCALMSIGGSPASTAGGMKTVTLAVLVLVVVGQLRRRKQVEGFRRSIPIAVVGRAVTVAALYVVLVGTVTLLLSVAMGPGYKFIDVLFEACSACGTVGLSTGLTGSLSEPGKVVIIVGMFVGRLGPLTLLAAMTSRLRKAEYTYPDEAVIIG